MDFQEHNTIVSIAQARAKMHGDRNYVVFLEDGDDVELFLTYSELDKSSRKVANWLSHNQITKGERAITILPNSIEFTKIFFGCLYSGVLAVPLAEPAGPQHMQSYLETFVPTLKVSQPKVLITTEQLVTFIKQQLPESLQSIFENIMIVSDQDVLSSSFPEVELPDISENDTAYLQFTSGSTGTPKGIQIGHCNIMANMKQAYTTCNWEENAGTALWLPLFHDFGLAAGMIGALYMGGFVVLMTPVHFILKPIRWLNMISKYKCSYSYAPPFAYEICRKKITNEDKATLDLSSLICSVYGAEPVQYSGVKGFNNEFEKCGLRSNAIRPGFGMAETVIMFSVSEKLSSLCVNRQLLETEGRIEFIDSNSEESEIKHLVDLGPMMDEHEIAIKNESNELVSEGTIGEILITGPSVCQGYFQNPEATKEIFQQQIKGRDAHFLSTGDLGLLWKGNLYFTGRKKDLIIIRGRNYYPQDIEFALTQIKELRAGCIVAYSDSNKEGEYLCLAMEVKKDLLKDQTMFDEYILPSIDQRILELIGNSFQIQPKKRIYLKPGMISKTSSGKIKHHKNVHSLKSGSMEGIVAQLETEEISHIASTEIETVIKALFRDKVNVEPEIEIPFFELGGDSIKIVEFVEAVQEKYSQLKFSLMDRVDESTTLTDLVNWINTESN